MAGVPCMFGLLFECGRGLSVLVRISISSSSFRPVGIVVDMNVVLLMVMIASLVLVVQERKLIKESSSSSRRATKSVATTTTTTTKP